MEKRGGKKGQFYIIATIVIIALAVGILAITNYSKKNDNSRVEELEKQLDIESKKFIEYSAKAGSYNWDAFTKNFSDYAGKDVRIYYFIKNDTQPCNGRGFYYNETGDKINKPTTMCPGSSNLIAGLNNIKYTFNLHTGENFNYIIYQESNEEVYTISSATKTERV